MNPPVSIYIQQKKNADLLRRRLSLPIAHGYNLPAAVDLRPWMTEVEDQGEMDSCVANAIAGALEYLYRRYTGQVVDVSRLFIDFNARLCYLNRSVQQHPANDRKDPSDIFETNRQAAIRGVQQYGFCTESLWPYDKDLYMCTPPKNIYKEAAHRSIIPLKVPINIVSVKTCLAYQIPVLIGIQLHRNEAYNNHGYVHIPKISPNEGFHACLVVGYNDRNQHFIIRNSWGSDWGDQGYFYVPYKYLIDKRLVVTADAFWAIAEIVPRRMKRRGYISYPNFTQYHQQYMLPLTDKNYQEQQQKYRYRRRRHYYQ